MSGPVSSRLRQRHQGEVLTPLISRWLRVNRENPFSRHTLDVLTELHLRPRGDRSGVFSISQLGTCMRAQVMAHWGAEGVELPDDQLHSIFHDGHWRHLRWQGVLLELGVVCGVTPTGMIVPPSWTARWPVVQPALEVAVRDPARRLRGTLDVIVEVDEIRYLVDVKGANTGSFADARRGVVPLSYLWQLETYRACTNIENALLLYEDKGTQAMLERHLAPRPSPAGRAVDVRIAALNHHVDARTMPPQLPDYPHVPTCRRCPLQLECPTAEKHIDEVPV